MGSSSDYGSELDFADADLEAQLRAAELPRVERAAQVDIALEEPQDESQAAQQHGVLPLEDALLVQAQARQSLWCVALLLLLLLLPALLDASLADTHSPTSRDRFRKSRGWGALSVSDLTGPSWCEWQHSYRLLTKPHLPPLARPATITSASGATIAVDTARTVKREGVLDRGRAVHAKIEREVMGPIEEVKVEVQGKEEWWALRILNTAACVETLLETGRVVRPPLSLSLLHCSRCRADARTFLQREVPVVGWIGEFLVFGVCDEIERREVPPPSSPPLPTKRDLANPSDAPRPPTPTTPKKDQQPTLKQFFSPIESPSKRPEGKERSDSVVDLTVEQDEVGSSPEPRWRFVLSDTKTRCVSLSLASLICNLNHRTDVSHRQVQPLHPGRGRVARRPPPAHAVPPPPPLLPSPVPPSILFPLDLLQPGALLLGPPLRPPRPRPVQAPRARLPRLDHAPPRRRAHVRRCDIAQRLCRRPRTVWRAARRRGVARGRDGDLVPLAGRRGRRRARREEEEKVEGTPRGK